MSETPPPHDAEDAVADQRPSPSPAPPPEPASAVPAYVPQPFPQVLRTPWVNPAKRSQLTLLAIVALLVVAGAAFIAGVAAGGGHERDRMGPGMRDGFGVYCTHGHCLPDMRLKLPHRQPPLPGYPSSTTAPSPGKSSSH